MANITDALIDKRTVDRNIKKGALSRKDYQSYLESLPDVASNAEVIVLEADDDDASDSEG